MAGTQNMKAPILRTLALMLVVAEPLLAQRARVNVSGGEVERTPREDASRLATRIPGIDAELRARLQVGGDSAQRIAMNDFAWKGRVSSVEIDEEDTRVFWDVKIVPDSAQQTIVRYRVDATNGAILGVKQFTGVRGLIIRKP